MPALDKTLFDGQHALDPYIREKECKNFTSDAEEILKERGWDGKIAGCIGLKLSSDNGKVENGIFLVKGSLCEDWIQINAKKIWPDMDNSVSLFLRFPNAEIFKFSDGGLTSDIVAQDEVDHGVFIVCEGRTPTPILEASYEEWGVGDFSLRMLCVLSKNSSATNGVLVKFTVLLFPESKQHLLENYEMAQSAAWPGVRVAEGEFQLLPKPAAKWRCPVSPLIMPGTSFIVTHRMPAPDEVRAAIAAIMSRTCLPEIGRTGAAVVARWKRVAERAEELVVKPGTVTWPKTAQQQQQQEQGKKKKCIS
jgi:hypothetical protein